ncbi:MAG: hypothetical protein EXQ92_05525 [Alphaproteobacteria bacterium]|nr:hypothetical protein [Alphaproteobacteria bacterium]
MLVLTVRHHINPGQFEAAYKRIVGNTDAMADIPGLLFRHTGTPPDSKAEIVTVTAWRSPADRAIWDERRKASPPLGDPKILYAKVETLEIEVADERWGPTVAAALAGAKR